VIAPTWKGERKEKERLMLSDGKNEQHGFRGGDRRIFGLPRGAMVQSHTVHQIPDSIFHRTNATLCHQRAHLVRCSRLKRVYLFLSLHLSKSNNRFIIVSGSYDTVLFTFINYYHNNY
jgi:hypothetical protein